MVAPRVETELPPISPEEFWAEVIVGEPDECWPWRRAAESDRYGSLSLAGRSYQAHRVAWSLHNGEPVPPTLFVRHGCDWPPCCNPAHLEPGNARQNTQDMVARGRSRNGKAEARLRWTTAHPTVELASTSAPTSSLPRGTRLVAQEDGSTQVIYPDGTSVVRRPVRADAASRTHVAHADAQIN